MQLGFIGGTVDVENNTSRFAGGYARFQNNIQCLFNRVRLLYGANPIEDILREDIVARLLTESTTSNDGVFDQTTIAEGIGLATPQPASLTTTPLAGFAVTTASCVTNMVNVRDHYIQGIYPNSKEPTNTVLQYVPNRTTGSSYFASPFCTRRYQIQLPLGLLTQSKLLPCKFMASQLAIEITLNPAATAIIYNPGNMATPGLGGTALTLTSTVRPSYQITNCNLIPEILEFDSSYG